MENKIRVGILFGGRSAEHEVSLVSASSIIEALDRKKYVVFPIGITPEGRWLSSKDAIKLLKEKSSVESLPEHLILPDPRKQGLVEINTSGVAEIQNIDVVFPVMHGTFGEDGTVQGLLELAGVPYVGAGVLGSAVGMDKVIQKLVLEAAKIRVAQGLSFLISEFEEGQKKIVVRIEEELQYPCFVKPSNTGSSIGISKAHDQKELIDAVALAGQYDRKIVVEKSIEKAREMKEELAAKMHDYLSRENAYITQEDARLLDEARAYDADARALRLGEVGVHHGFSAAQEERIGAAQMKRAAHGMLKADSVALHPLSTGGRSADRHARHLLVGLASGHAQNVVVELVFRIGIGHHLGWRVVHAPQVSGVPAIAATKLFRRALQHQHAGPGFARAQSSRQSRIASAYYQNIKSR